MKKFFRWLFDYTSQVRFESKLPIEDVHKRLSVVVRPDTVFTAWLSAVSKKGLVGIIRGEKVYIYVARPGFSLTYNPHFFGKFSKDSQILALQGKFSVSSYGKSFTCISFVFLSLMEIFSLFGPLLPGTEIYSVNGLLALVLVIPLIGAIHILQILLIKKYTKADIQLISDAIVKELEV